MNDYLVRQRDNRGPEMNTYLEDRVKALRDERAVLLRSLSEAQAQARYWQAIAEEKQSEIDFLKAELTRHES